MSPNGSQIFIAFLACALFIAAVVVLCFFLSRHRQRQQEARAAEAITKASDSDSDRDFDSQQNPSLPLYR